MEEGDFVNVYSPKEDRWQGAILIHFEPKPWNDNCDINVDGWKCLVDSEPDKEDWIASHNIKKG